MNYNVEDIKVCVYAICKNEEMFAERWLKSAEEADAIFVNDTGSTDKTVEILEKHPKVTLIHSKFTDDKFRFDSAWNELLDIIPEEFDFCVRLDLDIMASCGWIYYIKNKIAEIINSNEYILATDLIKIGINQIQMPILFQNFQLYSFSTPFIHSNSKKIRYYGAVHEDIYFYTLFNRITFDNVDPNLAKIIHTENNTNINKFYKYDSLSKIELNRCPTYVNLIKHISQCMDILEGYSYLKNYISEISQSDNNALERLAYGIKHNTFTSKIYILYLYLIYCTFYTKDKEEIRKTYNEILNNKNLSIKRASKLSYFDPCVTYFFEKLSELKITLTDKEKDIPNQNLKKQDKDLYNYILETFREYI